MSDKENLVSPPASSSESRGKVVACYDDNQYLSEWEEAAREGKLCVVDCHAAWCGPCRAIAPVFENLAKEYPHVLFLKVDVDKCKRTAKNLGVIAMPSFFFFKAGEKVGGFMGASEAKIRQGLENDGKVSDICSMIANACVIA